MGFSGDTVHGDIPFIHHCKSTQRIAFGKRGFGGILGGLEGLTSTWLG